MAPRDILFRFLQDVLKVTTVSDLLQCPGDDRQTSASKSRKDESGSCYITKPLLSVSNDLEPRLAKEAGTRFGADNASLIYLELLITDAV